MFVQSHLVYITTQLELLVILLALKSTSTESMVRKSGSVRDVRRNMPSSLIGKLT
jgi:DMSO/TMAO reductase YedYZ heme-binding membrane subunit